ncbi:MAG: hypothetical protein U1F57_04670 [bacterium]
MIPIILLSVACAVLLQSDSPTKNGRSGPSTPPPETPLPPESPPGPPIADFSILPRGVPPQLFRSNARTVASELQSLFIRAYQLDHRTETLRISDSPTANKLQERLKQLTLIAQHDPWAAREYNRPEIVKYDYFTQENAHTAYLLVRMHQDPKVLEEYLKNTIIDSVQSAEDPFTTPWLIPPAILLRTLGEEKITPVLTQIAKEEVSTDRLITDSNLRETLNAASTQDLLALYRHLDGHSENKEFYLKSTKAAPPIFSSIASSFHTLSEEKERESWDDIIRYIPFVLSSRGMTPKEFGLELSHSQELEHPDPVTARLAHEQSMASYSPDPFDDASHGHTLHEELRNYRKGNASATVAQKCELSHIRRGIALYHGLADPLFDQKLTSTDLDKLFTAEEGGEETALPPLSEASIERELNLGNSLEIPLTRLPLGWQESAQKMGIILDGYRLSLWDFLKGNVSRVAFTPRKREGEAGTVNPLTRTVVLEIQDNQSFDPQLYFSTLAHEAYHLYFDRTQAFQNPKLLRSRLLNERNAFLFQSRVDKSLLEKKLKEGVSFDSPSLQPYFKIYIDNRISGLAANEPLGFSQEDETLHYSLEPKYSGWESKNAYPTDYFDEYLSKLSYISDNYYEKEIGRLKKNYKIYGRIVP